MDPDANLLEQRSLAADIMKVWDDCNADGTLTQSQMSHVADQANRLAELVQALDGWLCGMGFLPAAWRNQQR